MGQVYEVKHIELGRTAALKMMRPELAQNEETAARFFTEARAMSMVHHAGLIHVYEYGHTDDGGAYIVMEFAEGPTLSQHMESKGGKLPMLSAVTLAHQIAAALHAAHEKGVVHRDLKPDNIAIVGGEDASLESTIKVLDFGLAKLPSENAAPTGPKTMPGQVLGTPLYMAPEQAGATGGIGQHTDVYSLGAVLFEMLAGTPPFTADGAVQLVGKHLFSTPPRLHTLRPEVPDELDTLVHAMLAKAPADRPRMREVKEQLKQIRQTLAAGPTPHLATKTEAISQAVTMLMRRGKLTSRQAPPTPLASLGWPTQKLPTLLLTSILGGLLLWAIWNTLRSTTSAPNTSSSVSAPPVGASPAQSTTPTGRTPTPMPTLPPPVPPPGGASTPTNAAGTSSSSRRRAPRPAPSPEPVEPMPLRRDPAIRIVD